MRGRVAGTAVSIDAALSVAASTGIAQSSASRVDAHVAAAKAAAGTDFAGVFNRICAEANPPATPATPRPAAPRPAGPPPPPGWHAQPVEVFHHLYSPRPTA